MTADPSSIVRVRFVFGPYTLDTRAKRLFREGTVVPLTTKAFDTLEVLLRASGQTVSKDELLRQVWPGTFVQEDTLAQNVSTIRRALGETADSPRHILTVPREGYRFVAPVETVYGEPAESAPTQKPTGRPSTIRHQARSRRRFVQFMVGAASGTIVAALAIRWLRPPGSDTPPSIPITFEVFEPDGTRLSSSGGVLALSPDGRHLAFIAEGPDGQDHLWIRASGSRESTRLPATQDASQPFWSADGQSIAFFSRGALRSIALSGGEARTISQLSASANALTGSWSSGNLILFSLQGKGLFQVHSSGGDAAPFQVPGMRDCSTCAWPVFLPDGRHFLFTADGGPSDRGIYVGSLDGVAPRRLLDLVSSAAYTTDGYIVYASGGALVARRFDLARGQLASEIVPVADRVWFNPITARAVFSVSNAGLLAYREPLATRLQWISRGGNVISAGPEGLFHSFAVSATGRVLASQLDPQRGTYDLWVYDRDWRTATRLTFDPASDLRPLWSDDGTSAVFARNRADGWQLYTLDIDRPGVERALLPHPTSDTLAPIFWKEDALYYATLRPGKGSRIWTIRTGGDDRSPEVLTDPSDDDNDRRIAPDGRWIAYTVHVMDSRTPQTALFVRPWPSGPGRSQIAAEGSVPRWRADGGELYFIAPNGRLMAALMNNGVAAGPPVSLCPTDALPTSGLAGDAYDATPDGQRFLVKVPARRSSIVMVSGWSNARSR
jgi:DNA-binding winged helix-turn-helix (wHTH) protein/Tol biopolymer transport system component